MVIENQDGDAAYNNESENDTCQYVDKVEGKGKKKGKDACQNKESSGCPGEFMPIAVELFFIEKSQQLQLFFLPDHKSEENQVSGCKGADEQSGNKQ